MKKTLATLSASSGAFLLSASRVLAQNDTITIAQPDNTVNNIGNLITAGFNAAIIFAILFVFAMLIMGGYGWLTAGGDKAKVEEARTRITNAVIGLAIVASAWALINIVSNFFYGEDFGDFDIPSVIEPTSSGSQT